MFVTWQANRCSTGTELNPVPNIFTRVANACLPSEGNSEGNMLQTLRRRQVSEMLVSWLRPIFRVFDCFFTSGIQSHRDCTGQHLCGLSDTEDHQP